MAYNDTIHDNKSHFDLYTLQLLWELCLAFCPIDVNINVMFMILNQGQTLLSHCLHEAMRQGQSFIKNAMQWHNI